LTAQRLLVERKEQKIPTELESASSALCVLSYARLQNGNPWSTELGGKT
jgi:hypothetical protein